MWKTIQHSVFQFAYLLIGCIIYVLVILETPWEMDWNQANAYTEP